MKLCFFYICYYLKADWLWFIMWLSHRCLLLVVISVLNRFKTDFSTSIGWYINIISVNEITVFNCKFKLKSKMLLPYFYGRIFFLQCVIHVSALKSQPPSGGVLCQSTWNNPVQRVLLQIRSDERSAKVSVWGLVFEMSSRRRRGETRRIAPLITRFRLWIQLQIFPLSIHHHLKQSQCRIFPALWS